MFLIYVLKMSPFLYAVCAFHTSEIKLLPKYIYIYIYIYIIYIYILYMYIYKYIYNKIIIIIKIKFAYIAHHLILLHLNLFDLRVDWEGW